MGHLLVVLCAAKPGRDEELNAWYDAVHVHDMLETIEGFDSVRRFVRADLPDVPIHPYRYLAIYEVSDLELAHEQFQMQRAQRAEALATGREPLVAASGAMADDVLVGFFSALGDPVVSTRAKAQ